MEGCCPLSLVVTNDYELLVYSAEPSPPPQPKVSVDKKGGKVENKSFTAELYPTDNHFGPIRCTQQHCQLQSPRSCPT